MKAIKCAGIQKSYKDVKALKHIDLEVEQGELFGLIGPDGAGKSTLFRILTSLLIPDSGSASVLGLDTVRDFRKIRKIVGYMPGKFSLYQDLTVAENLNFFATIFGTSLQENYDLIKEIYVQLEPFKDRRAGKLSGGMKQKLALCCALIHSPEILFLDEPTTGVDAVSRAEFWDMLKRIKARGISILVSTPYMDEASRCERIALIQQGSIMQIDTPSGIRKSYTKNLFAVKAKEFYMLLKDLRDQPFATRVEPFGEFLHLSLHPRYSESGVLQYMKRMGYTDPEITPIQAGIEDVFLDLMQT